MCDKFDMLMTGESVLMSNMTIENDAYTTESVTASNTVVGVVIGVVSTVAIIIVGLVVIFLIRYCRTTSSCSFWAQCFYSFSLYLIVLFL